MSALADWLKRVLPADTATTWELIAPIVPEAAYLAGGTAITVHIQHRVSRDLDFFFHDNAVDLDALTEVLQGTGPFAITRRSAGTLNGLFSETKVQFLHADEGQRQRLLGKPSVVEGLRIAGLPDLMATKLKVIAQSGELRDYFDLQQIEEKTGHTVDEGLGYFLARFESVDRRNQVVAIINALGYLDDVDEDQALPASKEDIAAYWARRQPEVLKAAGWLTSGGNPPPAPLIPPVAGEPSSDEGWVQPHSRGGNPVKGYKRRPRTP